ncbi:MAG: methionine--tRNA ligase [Cyanobacteria bacterium REEB446]|nr:methionine--tRNA ligase [Cyanobacteria bacterium REEB446]
MKYYITTPLYYVNDNPHIGSAYPTIACDFLAGHFVQTGAQLSFLTGTDEHGQKIEKAAKARGLPPKAHCDEIVSEFKRLWEILEIKSTHFVRTSADQHKAFVSDFFQQVKNNGYIYKGEYKGLYCVSCEDFKLEKDLEENPEGKLQCPVHKQPVEEYSQENYFFALSKFEKRLKDYISSNPDFISPNYRKNEVLSWLDEGLRDFPISRVGLEWGIDIPGDTSQKIYVWFDALLGYISALGDDREAFWQDDQEHSIIHIIGKDILRFHAIYWPAMLMAADYPLPKKVFGHGFLTKDGMKMGKTIGNIIDPFELIQEFGADAVKFFFLREFPFGRDGDYSRLAMINRLNSDLANNLGNLLNRSTNLLRKYFSNENPENEFGKEAFTELTINNEIIQGINHYFTDFRAEVTNIDFFSAFNSVFTALNEMNLSMSNIAPWTLLKEGSLENRKKAFSCLYASLEACRKAAICLASLTPNLSKNIFIQLGIINADYDMSNRTLSLSSDFSFENFTEKPLNLSNIENILEGESKPIFERIVEKEPA